MEFTKNDFLKIYTILQNNWYIFIEPKLKDIVEFIKNNLSDNLDFDKNIKGKYWIFDFENIELCLQSKFIRILENKDCFDCQNDWKCENYFLNHFKWIHIIYDKKNIDIEKLLERFN